MGRSRKLKGGMPPKKKEPKVKTFDSIFQAIDGTVAQLKAYLKANPQSVNEIGEDGNTPLHFAVDTYTVSKVQLMLDAYRDINADMNVKNTAGNSPFLGLCEYSTDLKNDKATYDIFILFMQEKINYNVQNAKGETAFMVFLRKNHIVPFLSLYEERILTQFIRATQHMDLNIKNNEGENVLFYLVRNNPNMTNSILVLLQKGIDVNVVNAQGLTALFMLIEEYKKNNIPDIIQIMDAFVNKGYEINKPLVTTELSYTPFVSVVLPLTDQNTALNHRLKELARNMLNRYVIDVNIKTMRDITALHILSKHKYKDLVQLVLDKGADINAQTSDIGATPLMFAVYDNHIEIVKLLLEKGADKNIKNKRGNTAYDIARTEEMKELLQPKATAKEKLYKGFSKSDMEIYDALFENPKDWSICPVCLSFSERKEGCMIMGHDCAKQKIFYHTDLYKKYVFLDGYGNNLVEWCTICGRACKNHKHYALVLPEDTAKLAIITPAMEARMRERGTGVYFEDGNCIGLGGGGVEEKVARFRRLREYAGELQEQVGKISDSKARTELIEEIWKAPLFKTKKYKNILEKKKLNIGTNVFPERIANNVEEEKVYRNVPLPASREYPIKLGTEPECVIEGAIDERVSIKYQFQHQDVEGGSNHDILYICNEDIENYIEQKNKAFGTPEFGKCWLPNCTAKIYPEEVEAIISPAIYEDYKKKFNRKFGVEEEGDEPVREPVLAVPDVNAILLQVEDWIDEEIPNLVEQHQDQVAAQLRLIEQGDFNLENMIENNIREYIEEYEERIAIGDGERRLIRYAVTKGLAAGLLDETGMDFLVIGALERYLELIEDDLENQNGGKRNTRKKGKKGNKGKKKAKKTRRRKQRGGDIPHVFHKLDFDSAVCLPFLKA